MHGTTIGRSLWSKCTVSYVLIKIFNPMSLSPRLLKHSGRFEMLNTNPVGKWSTSRDIDFKLSCQKYCPKSRFTTKVGIFTNWNNNRIELLKFIQNSYMRIFTRKICFWFLFILSIHFTRFCIHFYTIVKMECQAHIQIWGLGANFGEDSPFITLCLGKSRCNSCKYEVFIISII